MIFLLLLLQATAQTIYFPNAVWQAKSAKQAGINKEKLDSAVAFAIIDKNKVERDLRIAIMKAYARETGYAV